MTDDSSTLSAFALALAKAVKEGPKKSIEALKNELAPRFKIEGVPKNAAAAPEGTDMPCGADVK